MKSTCYVVLPQDLLLVYDSVYHFVKTQIGKYHIEYEVEPYKYFFSEEQTGEIARRKGYDTIADFKAALEIKNEDDGIENNQYYWISTWNPQGHWDYFILEDIKPCQSLINDMIPYSVVDADGRWHSEQEYGYKPILDFELNAQHPDNIKVEYEWKHFLTRTFFHSFINHKVAILTVHT